MNPLRTCMSAQLMTSYPVSAPGRKSQVSQALQATKPHLRDRIWHEKGSLLVIFSFSLHDRMETLSSHSFGKFTTREVCWWRTLKASFKAKYEFKVIATVFFKPGLRFFGSFLPVETNIVSSIKLIRPPESLCVQPLLGFYRICVKSKIALVTVSGC